MSDHKTRQTARIVEATLRVLSAEGMSRVSMSKVASAAGVTRQTVYNYFPDVESILARVMDEHASAMERHLLDVLNDAEGPREQLRAFAAFQITHASPEHAGLALELGLSPEVRARIDAHTDGVKSALAETIASGIAEGSFTDGLTPTTAAELQWGLVQGGVEAAMKHPEDKPALIDAVTRAMWAAVTE